MNLKLKHKRLYALALALCLILSLAMLFTACGDDTPDDPNPPAPEYVEGPEVGVYYYEVAGGEIVLTLSGGNNFTLAGPDYNKAGTYTVDNGNMVLDFAKDEDGTVTATITGDKIALSYNNNTMTLLKKMSYTVSFSVDGGSEVAAMTVLNGKTASKPADPTKDGYVFLGWYADAALTTPYAFSTATVTADTTVYAKWVKEEVGPVYNVALDLGYEGAEALEAIKTVNGVAYGVPTPTREGYTFGGWWISMYDDAEKLTYQYTESTVFNTDTTLYAVWYDGSATLAAPNASIEGNNVKWNAVSGALTYQVKVMDKDGDVLAETTTASYTYTYNFGIEPAGEYIVEVVAVGGSGQTSAATVRYYANKTLDRVSGLKVVDGILVFTPVANAEGYLITVDCGNKNHNHTSFNNGKSTYFDFSNCSMQKGGIKFTVTAVAAGYASSTSKTLVYEKNLDAVSGVVYNEASDAFVWNAVENATSYAVTVVIGEKAYVYNVGMSTSFSTADYTGDITVRVVPVSEGYNSPEAASASYTKTAPAAPQNLNFSETTLTWESDADSYIIKIAGKQYTVNGTSFNFASKLTELDLDLGDECVISVIAVKDGKQSTAATVSAKYREMSTNISYYKNTVSWPAVFGGSNFKVRVNGGEEIIVSGKNFTTVVLTKAGENVIEVICTDITSSWDAASTVTVTAYEVIYMTRSESGEYKEYLAIGDAMTPPTDMTLDRYTFDAWYNTPNGADGNGKKYSFDAFVGTGNLTLYANWSPNSYSIKLEVDSDIDNIAAGELATVIYTKNFTLPVPTTENEAKGYFVGWFTAPYGGGTKITDDMGVSLEPYGTKNGIADTLFTVVYPYFADAFSYEKLSDGTYGVKKGLGISNRNVTDIKIPATYNGIAVTQILPNAFHSCYNIVSIAIPDTIMEIGTGAFELCNKLNSVEVYMVDPMNPSESPYSSSNGALLYYHESSDETYLEFFPAAKTGTYTIPEQVTIIRPNAFKNAKISKIVISKGVKTLSANSFANCQKLTEIEFQFERTESITIEDGAFVDLPNVTTLILPALLNEINNIKMFDTFEDLRTVIVEEGGLYYSSSNNLLCDQFGTTLLYVPRSFKGVFEVPLGINLLGDQLFYNNSYITEVIIGEHINFIGADAFMNCSALKKVTFKGPRDNKLEISSQAFKNCNALKEVIFEGGVDVNEGGPIIIGSLAFENCPVLQTVEVGEQVVINNVGTRAFANNPALEAINIAANAQFRQIGDYAFEKCTQLREFEIHSTTISVGNGAFEGCSHLGVISLGEGIGDLALGADVFKDCVRLYTISLPSTMTEFDSSLFDGCEHLQNIYVDEDNPFLETDDDGVLYTKGCTELLYYPRTKNIENGALVLNNPNLTKIGASVFKNNPKVITVTIGANVTEISKNAFENCVNLTTVTFEGTNAAFTVGDYAFSGCTNLASLTLPATTDAIGHSAFYMTKFESFTIPASVTTIGTNAFAYTNLSTITIPASVTAIGDGAFYGAAKLTNIVFDERTDAIELGKVWLDSKHDDIKQGIFVGTAFTEITLPKEVSYIGGYAFANLTALTSVTIPANSMLNEIAPYAFYKTGITAITLSAPLQVIGNYAFAYTKLTSVNVPETVAFIGSYAFATPTVSEITIAEGNPENVSLTIKPNAFVGTTISSITLPAQLYKIGEKNETYGYTSAYGVFYDETTGQQEFTANPNLAKIYVSENCPGFMAIGGVLYTKSIYDGTAKELLFSPKENTGDLLVPKTVTRVHNTAFVDTKLTSIVFEEYDKVTEEAAYYTPTLVIGTYNAGKVNYGCPAVISNERFGHDATLTLIKFPSHLSAINSYAITNYNLNQQAKQQAELVIQFSPDSTVSFALASVRLNSAIKRIELPKIKSISSYAFNANSNLSELTFTPGSTITDIGSRSFEGCSKITSFTIPATVTAIQDMAFYGCSGLTELKYEDGCSLKTIGNQAFFGTGFTSFKMADSVTAVGTDVFKSSKIEVLEISANLVIDGSTGGSLVQGCNTIKAIVVPEEHETLSSFNGVLYDKNQTVLYVYPVAKDDLSYTIPDTVHTIMPGGCSGYKGTSLTLPAALTSIGDSAFFQSKLQSIVIPANVTSIGNRAFYYCQDLKTLEFAPGSKLTSIGANAFTHIGVTSVVLPDSITQIGTSAFEGCMSLQNVKLPEKLETLSNMVFKSCKALESIELNESLKTITSNAFSYCESLKSISIPDSVTNIGQYAFSNCISLKSFVCSDSSGLIDVGYSCFYACESLETVVFGPSATRFGMNAYTGRYNTFDGCTALRSVTLPDEMTELPDGFFANCANLEEVTLPADLEIIGIQAFVNCTKLKKVTIPASLKTVNDAAFAGCTALTEVNFELGCALDAIATNMFALCTNLTTINLPASIVTIGEGAFAQSAITSIEFPEILEEIGAEAFVNCENLTSISIPGSVRSIGANAFTGCKNVETLTIGSGVKSIGSFAFADCTSIKAVTIPATVAIIGDNPFTNCPALESFTLESGSTNFIYQNGVLYDSTGYTLIYYAVTNDAKTFTIPDTVFEIAGGAFSASKLESIAITEHIKAVPAAAFKNSTALKTVVIPETVRSIGAGAFMGCSSIEAITIPASVTTLSDYAFANCSSLSNFVLATRKTDMTVGEGIFSGCSSITALVDFPGVKDFTPYMYAGTGLTSVVIPNTVTTLNVEGVFAGCDKLASVTFPTLTGHHTLGSKFFMGTALTNVTIPSQFNQIESYAFANCDKLQTISLAAHSIREGAFEGCTALTNVNSTISDPNQLISVSKRAFANCTSFNDVTFISRVYQFEEEAFAGCTALSGEINIRPSNIGNGAFSGCNAITMLTISGSELYIMPDAFAGLTEATTVYLKSFSSLEAAMERLSSNVDFTASSNAKFKFYTPGGNTVEVTLTDEELKTLEMYVGEGLIAKEMVDTIKEKWLAYKASYTTLFPADELTKPEIEAITLFCEECKISEKLVGELPKMWIEYRYALSKELTQHPLYFTAEENSWFESNLGEDRINKGAMNAFMQAWFDYKVSYSEANPSDALTKEEIEALNVFCKELGIGEKFMSELEKLWPEYKKTLAANLSTPPTIDLTDAELKALEQFCGSNGIKEGLEPIKLAWMQYKGSFDLTEKQEKLTEEQIALVDAMISTYGLEPKLAGELYDKFLAYINTYVGKVAQAQLNDEELKQLEEFCGNNGIKGSYEAIMADWVQYKKAFFLSEEQPGKELSDEEKSMMSEFIAKYSLEPKLEAELCQQWMEYRMKLAGRM